MHTIDDLYVMFSVAALKDLKLYTSLVEKLCEIDSKMNTHRKALAESYAEQTVECFDQVI